MPNDETYDPQRAEKLVEMLRALAQRIIALDGDGQLLGDSAALLRALGDIRSELFSYEVRHTFDSPEVAERRRIVEEASRGWKPETDDGPDEEDPWQKPDDR
jgi:hypothetical protein